jgi:hypothetical protein
MPNHNLTDIQKIMVGIAYKDGQRIGERISAAIESGELEIPDNGTLEILIDKFFTYELPRSQKLLLLLGSPEASTTGNLACAAGGLVIGGVSTQNFLQTKNRVAQFFYCGSIVCSGTAVIAGSFKAFGNVCGFSHLAIAGDFFGGGCLFLGNRSRKFGNYFEGKGGTDNLNPFRPRSFARRPKKGIGMGYKGMSFIASSDVPVSFQKIIVIGGTVFTIYCYGKLIISVYNYLHSKLLPKKNPSQAIHVSARFLTDSFKNTNYTERIQKV